MSWVVHGGVGVERAVAGNNSHCPPSPNPHLHTVLFALSSRPRASWQAAGRPHVGRACGVATNAQLTISCLHSVVPHRPRPVH